MISVFLAGQQGQHEMGMDGTREKAVLGMALERMARVILM